MGLTSVNGGLMDPSSVSQSASLLTKEGEGEIDVRQGVVCYKSQGRGDFSE